jgi:hypothetical protein
MPNILKTNRLYVRLLWGLCLCISLTACKKCKKDPNPDPGYSAPMQRDLYAYAFFQPGTYWVYEDSVSHIIDSVYVIYADSSTYTNNETNADHYKGTFHRFQCKMISSYDHYMYQNWMDQSYEVNGSAPTVNRERYIMPGSGNINGRTINIAICNVGKSLSVALDYVTYVNYYPSLSLNGQGFSSVQKWFTYNSNCDDNKNAYYYISKNVGIIRREQVDSNRTWNLIRYHINQ